MTTLTDVFLDPDKRPRIVDDCVRLVEDEVKGKKGLGGVAVRGGYAVVKKVKPGIIRETVDNMLPEFVERLEPFYADFVAQNDSPLEPYLKGRDVEVANALLTVTDGRAQRTKHRTLKAAYQKLRPTGVKHTAAAVPGLARLIQKHV